MLDIAQLRIECTSHSETHGRYEIEPLEEGYGVTLGNSLRRILISSLAGSAITSVKLDGIMHDFTAIPHAMEDMTEFLLNLKKVRIKNFAKQQVMIDLDVLGDTSGAREVTAGDLTVPPELEIVNPDQYLLTLDGPDAELHGRLTVDYGTGFYPVEGRDSREIGLVPVDAVFSPIRRVNYYIERRRVGQMTNKERLVLEVWSDGTMDPTDAVSQSADVLMRYFKQITEMSKPAAPAERQALGKSNLPSHLYEMPIEALDLSPRAFNALKRGNITRIGEILEKSEDELLSIRNFGRKSLDELRERLALQGYLTIDPNETFSGSDEYYDTEDDE